MILKNFSRRHQRLATCVAIEKEVPSSRASHPSEQALSRFAPAMRWMGGGGGAQSFITRFLERLKSRYELPAFYFLGALPDDSCLNILFPRQQKIFYSLMKKKKSKHIFSVSWKIEKKFKCLIILIIWGTIFFSLEHEFCRGQRRSPAKFWVSKVNYRAPIFQFYFVLILSFAGATCLLLLHCIMYLAPGGVFFSKNFLPEVRPLTILYSIFDRKCILFVHLLLTNGAPFTYLA